MSPDELTTDAGISEKPKRRVDAAVAAVDAVAAPDAPAGEPAHEDGPATPLSLVSGKTVHIHDHFAYPGSLITNEYATWNPNDPAAVKNPLWWMNSGTIYARLETAWTGVPDGVSPDRLSTSSNGSAVFRMLSARNDLADVSVLVTLKNNGYVSTSRTPAVAWDGVHVFLRYVSEENLYYVSVNRRDNVILVKKKVPGGSTNGGTYYTLTAETPHAVPIGAWQWLRATIRTLSTGAVEIQLFDGATNQRLLSVIDDGSKGGPPITRPGSVGIRGDNCDFQLGRMLVTSL